MKKTWITRLLLVALAVGCMAPGCDGDVLKDSTFRLWCGDSLCDWKLEQGRVQRAPTWHQDDYGVELVDPSTVISQESTEGSACMEFSAIADVDDAAQAQIQVDFNFDGIPDFEAQIAQTSWHPTKTLIYAPEGYGQDLRFVIRKNGAGRAVLAEIRLQSVKTCSGTRPVLVNRRVGDGCEADADCNSGICCGTVCSTCCDTRATCSNGASCKAGCAAAIEAESIVRHPFLCDPGLGRGGPGDPCTEGADCASNGCDGAILHAVPGFGVLGGAACAGSRILAGRCR